MAQLTLQPSEAEANDSRIASGLLDDTNYDGEGLRLRAPMTGVIMRSLVSFDLSAIPAGSKIGQAVFWLYFAEGPASPGQDDSWRAYRCTQPAWLDSAVTWKKYDGVNYWTNPGGDYDAGDYVQATPLVSPCWKELPLTALTQDALDHRDGLLNLLLRFTDESPSISGMTYEMYCSSGKNRPKLVVTYAPPLSVTEGPESLAPFLSNPIAGSEQADPRESLGGWRSDIRAELLGWRIRPRPIRGLAIEYVSPACGAGVGRIQAVAADQVAWAAPGQELGPAVTLAAGQSAALIGAGDPARYVRGRRDDPPAAGDLAGVTELELQPGWNSVLCGSNLTPTEQAGGTDRVHLLLFVAPGTRTVKDIRIWTAKLGTEQAVANAGLAGLPAAGAGRLKLASTADWHPGCRFVLVTAPGGDTANPKEILCGHLEGDEFVVPASGRAVYGIGPAASADGDLAFPFCGARLAGETTASDSLPGGWPVADEKTVPGGQSWRYGLGPANPPAGGGAVGWQLPPGDVTRLGVWVHLEVPAGYTLSAAVPMSLCWRFTVDDDDGQPVTYVFESEGLFRWGGAVDVYAAYRSVDGGDIDYESPVAVSDTLPFDAPVVDDAVNRIEVWKYNAFGLGAKIGEETFDVAGEAEQAPPPQEPAWLAVRQVAAQQIVVSALYRAGLDPDPADYWHMVISNLTNPGVGEYSDESIPVVARQGLAELSATKIGAPWDFTDELEIKVRMRRSGDSTYSGYLVKTITLAGEAPAEPDRGQSFMAARRAEF